MEHSQLAKSQHAQLVSTDHVNASPIAEEDEGVETSSPSPRFEPIPHCPLSTVPDEGVAGATVVYDSDLDVVADQYILASREENTDLAQLNVPSEKSLAEISPTTNVQSVKIISQEDLDQLEKSNPLDAFDVLAQDVLLSQSTGKSSHVSTDDMSDISKENLLAELRSKVLEINLFEPIEHDDSIIAEVTDLLRRLTSLLPGSKIQEFSRALAPLMESVGQSFQQKRVVLAKLEEDTLHYDQLLDEVAAFKAKLKVFRQEIPLNQRKVAEIDSAIAKHQAEILNLETQKKELLSQENLMKQEAQVAIQKAKESKLSQQKIASLAEEDKAFDERLSDYKNQMTKLTSAFVI